MLAVCAALAFLIGFAIYTRMHAQRLEEQCNASNIQLASALSKIDALSSHDILTGALNRRALVETLEWELLRAKRTGHPFSFAIIDIDHFRTVNEKYGNTSRATYGAEKPSPIPPSSIIARTGPFPGRIGGEEFGIVLPATWLDQGMIAMGRLSKAVDACNWEHIAPDLKLTFSAGLTTNAVNDTAETIMQRAERALLRFKAKSEGRNRTVAAEEELPDMPPIDIDQSLLVRCPVPVA